jgi:hypothetical protein
MSALRGHLWCKSGCKRGARGCKGVNPVSPAGQEQPRLMRPLPDDLLHPPPSTFTSTATTPPTTPPAPALIVETLFSRTLRCSNSCPAPSVLMLRPFGPSHPAASRSSLTFSARHPSSARIRASKSSSRTLRCSRSGSSEPSRPAPPSVAVSRTSQCSRSAPDGASRLTDPLHVPVRLVRPSSRVVFALVILVTLLESNRMPERKSLTVRVICRKKGGALRIRPEGGVPGPKASRPHPVSSTSPAARGRQQSLPLWKSFITASIFWETSAL